MPGRLVCVGVGLRADAHVSPEVAAYVRAADRVAYLAANVMMASWIHTANPNAESLERFYAPGKLRRDTYREILAYLLEHVRGGANVCYALYGHPGVFSFVAHKAIRLLRAEGIEAFMLPAISAEDCLFADLGVDPGDHGCNSYEATDFLVHDRIADVTSPLILWQIGAIGNVRDFSSPAVRPVSILIEELIARYGAGHEVVVYEASPHPIMAPVMKRVALGTMSWRDVTAMSTLYVPALRRPALNLAMVERLGLTSDLADPEFSEEVRA